MNDETKDKITQYNRNRVYLSHDGKEATTSEVDLKYDEQFPYNKKISSKKSSNKIRIEDGMYKDEQYDPEIEEEQSVKQR